jgi:5-(aminomethyl)-3-furanmethanol phosphate kinase
VGQPGSPRTVTGRGRSRQAPDWVIKVGGSLGARPAQLRRLMEILAGAARRHWLVVVPGGGSFADAVRRADRRFALGDSPAHWMAILAMDQYGYLLARLAPGAALVRSRRELLPGRLNVLAPSAWLQQADPLPHSWEVTSDSIAAWFAGILGARRLMLVKHEDGFIGPDRGPGSMAPHMRQIVLDAFAGAVDRYFARALDPAIGCWFARGHLPHRIARLIETGAAQGAEVVARRDR